MHDNLAKEYITEQEMKRLTGKKQGVVKSQKTDSVNHRQLNPEQVLDNMSPAEEEAEKIKIQKIEEIRSKSDYSKLKDKASVDKMNMEMDRQLGGLLSKDIIDKKFGQMSSTIVNYLFPLGDRLASQIAGVFESTDNEKILKTKELIDNETMKAITEFKKACTTEDLGEK